MSESYSNASHAGSLPNSPEPSLTNPVKRSVADSESNIGSSWRDKYPSPRFQEMLKIRDQVEQSKIDDAKTTKGGFSKGDKSEQATEKPKSTNQSLSPPQDTKRV